MTPALDAGEGGVNIFRNCTQASANSSAMMASNG